MVTHPVGYGALLAARAAIGGVTAFNDVSGRHAQIVTGLGQWTRGKSFDTFGPSGPIPIVAVTNPLVWLATIPALVVVARRARRERRPEDALRPRHRPARLSTWPPGGSRIRNNLFHAEPARP